MPSTVDEDSLSALLTGLLGAFDFLLFDLDINGEPTFSATAEALFLLICILFDFPGALTRRLTVVDDFVLLLSLSVSLFAVGSNADIRSLIDAETFELVDKTESLDVRLNAGLVTARFLVLPE